ncbi:MAG: hypothetical protein FWC42_08390 [Proteobacteria bacterium]|nr:hypothetical protein [Pseudomonadota bacterium]
MNEPLKKFIATFVQREKQDRYWLLLDNAKRRSDGLWNLLHDTRHLDMTKFTRMPDTVDLEVLVAKRLKELGVKEKESGYVLAVWGEGELDGQMVELSTFLEKHGDDDSAIFFPRVNAGYYSNHECERYVFSAGN